MWKLKGSFPYTSCISYSQIINKDWKFKRPSKRLIRLIEEPRLQPTKTIKYTNINSYIYKQVNLTLIFLLNARKGWLKSLERKKKCYWRWGMIWNVLLGTGKERYINVIHIYVHTFMNRSFILSSKENKKQSFTW